MTEKAPLPLTVIIPIPSHQPRARGIYATTQLKPPTTIRFSPRDDELIHEAAEVCGVTYSAFIRWAASQLAVSVLGVDRYDDTGV